MSRDTTLAKIVWVRVEEGTPGLFVATSPDLKGLLVAKHSLEELEVAIPTAIRELYSACGLHVVVTKADDDNNDAGLEPWIAVPAAAIRQAATA